MISLAKGRPTFCVIDLEALRWNFHQARKKVGPGVKILSVVKANGYGHGACKVARTLENEGSDGFGVATVEEGVELRNRGIKSPILLLGGVWPEQLDELLQNNLTPVVSETEILHRIEVLAKKRGIALNFHLKVDTGMGRIGFLASEIDSWLPELRKLEALNLQGVLSHFSQAESVEGEYTQGQLGSFRDVVKRLRCEGYHPPLIHLANSAAVITLPPAYFTMVRPGLMLYGIHPSPRTACEVGLKPMLSWKTRIIQLKRVPKGFGISYGQTFVTQRDSFIATLPVGYADGYKRLLSNRGSVLVRGQRAPVVGNVTMDLTMVDVTDIRGVQQGDDVVLLGHQGEEAIPADEMAGWARTISYEILTSISVRVPRIHEGEKGE
ncbi:MAG: alanine racemase [Candidatus Binatia bacterium]